MFLPPPMFCQGADEPKIVVSVFLEYQHPASAVRRLGAPIQTRPRSKCSIRNETRDHCFGCTSEKHSYQMQNCSENCKDCSGYFRGVQRNLRYSSFAKENSKAQSMGVRGADSLFVTRIFSGSRWVQRGLSHPMCLSLARFRGASQPNSKRKYF